MKHSGIILATVGMLILCVLTLSLISMPGKSPAPPRPPEAEPPLKILADMTPDAASTPVEQPSPPPAAADAQPAQTEAGVVTGPDGCVLLGAPHRVNFLSGQGLTLMANYGGVYAFDSVTGKLKWYRYIESRRGSQGSTFGSEHVLVWLEENLYLLDAATGRETWSQVNAPYGHVRWALLSPDESRVVVCAEQHLVAYSVNGAERRALSRQDGSWTWGWLSDNKTIVTVTRNGKDENAPRIWKLVDTDTGETTGTWELAQSKDFVSRPSKQGQFIEKAEDDAKNPIVKIRDVRTGIVAHEFKTPEPITFAAWLPDAKRFMSMAENRRELRVTDSETGKVEFSLSQEGHRFCSTWAFESNPDSEWAISQDETNNWYAWPVAADGTPRKVLSGRGIAAGRYYLRGQGKSYLLMDRSLESHLWVHAAYAIEDQRKLAEWRVRGEEEWFMDCMINRDMTRLVRTRPIDPKSGGGGWEPKNMAFGVYARNNEAPLFMGPGRPTEISPDGRYLAVQSTDASASLYDLDTGLVVQEYHGPNDQEGQVYFSAVFSDDGRRMATRGSWVMEVTDLIEGYPRRTLDTKEGDRLGWRLVLSPDGSRVLCGGYPKAWLFDADTGTLLRTFEETERFAQLYGGGFWNGLAARAGDWAGSISDRFKSGAYLDAVFAEQGTRVITYAAGQVIRIWDAESGSLLRTIHTGLPEQRDKDGNIHNTIEIGANGRFAFSYSMNGYGVASLWSLSDGALLRRYQLPSWEDSWPRATILDDASGVYISNNDNLYRWPGILAGSSQASPEQATR